MTAPPRMKRQLSRGPCDISRGPHLRSRRPSPSARRRTRMDMLNASQDETRRGRRARRGQSRPRFTGSRTLSWTSLGPVVGSGRLGGADGRPPPVPSAALPSDRLVSSHPKGEPLVTPGRQRSRLLRLLQKQGPILGRTYEETWKCFWEPHARPGARCPGLLAGHRPARSAGRAFVPPIVRARSGVAAASSPPSSTSQVRR